MFLLSKEYWEVGQTGKKGRGVFAQKDIDAGTIIGDYIGKIIRESEEDNYDNGRHYYLMYYNDHASIYPKPRTAGVHLINHSCTPNTWMYTYKGHTLYFAIRHIFAGEELTVSYALSSEDSDCKPCAHLCHCKSSMCTGTMHLTKERYEKWEAFDRQVDKKTRKRPVTFGTDLPLLSSYPKDIPDNTIYTLFGSMYHESLELEDKEVPPMQELRAKIRQTGRTLAFPNLNLYILGILDNHIVSQTIFPRTLREVTEVHPAHKFFLKNSTDDFMA